MLASTFGPRPGSGEVLGGSLGNRLPNWLVVARERPAVCRAPIREEWLERGLLRSK